MEMKEDKNVVINIYGGTQQILPNATQAVQHFYGADISRDVFREGALSRQELSPEAKRLSAYINNVEELGVYLTRLSGCTTASELALVVVSMVENRTGVSKELWYVRALSGYSCRLLRGLRAAGLLITSVPVSMTHGREDLKKYLR